MNVGLVTTDLPVNDGGTRLVVLLLADCQISDQKENKSLLSEKGLLHICWNVESEARMLPPIQTVVKVSVRQDGAHESILRLA